MLALAWRNWWLAGGIGLAATIVFLSLLPGPVIEGYSLWDKLDHVVAYLALTLWFTGILERRRYPLAAAGAILLGLLMEGAQAALTTTRHADPTDVVANLTGVALALGASYLALGGWAARVELLLRASRRR